MSDIDVHHLAAAYALDALDHHERQAFEAHYEACEVCRADVLEFRDTMMHVAASLATPAPASLKSKVMAEIATTRQLSPSVSPIDMSRRRQMRSLTGVLALAAAMVAIVVGVVVFTGRDTTTYSDELARVLEQSDARVVDLENKSGTSGSFKVAWSGTLGEAVLIGENLPPAPQDKAYELWLITPDETKAMYVLDPATDGNVHRTMKATADPTAWAITVEPRAGTPVATGDIIYVATV